MYLLALSEAPGTRTRIWGCRCRTYTQKTMSVCAAPELGGCSVHGRIPFCVMESGFEQLLGFPVFKLVHTGQVLGKNCVELVGFSYKVALGIGKHWEGEVLRWSSFVWTVSIVIWRSWLSPWWKTSVLPPLLEGQMSSQYLVLTIEHKIGFHLHFESCARLASFVWDFCGALNRPLFLSSARTTFSISSQAQAFAVIIMQFHLG